jgi:RNA polymerase sigma-70 factor (ECF subfamily)
MNPPVLKRAEISLLAPAEAGGERVCSVPKELLALLYRQMRALAGPRRDLDDLVQAAAERALRALPRFEGRSALSTWTYGVAYRTVLDHDRWYRRWSRRFSLADSSEPPEPPSSWDGEVAFTELRRARRLHAALARLPASKRAVVVLHDLEGVDVKRIAEIVEANERTVRSRLRDGRKKLAALLVTDPLFDVEASG